MTGVLRFRVLGRPAPQGSKRVFTNPKTGKHHLVEQTHEHTRSWRQSVIDAAEKAMADYPSWEPYDQPVQLLAMFAFPRPQSHYGTGKNRGVLKSSAPYYPTGGVGDLSKLIRALEDAMTDCGVWRDDRFVVRYGERTGKYWAGDEPALALPGALVRVMPVTHW